ncbi:MAG: hypothetical protein K0S45_1699 [Nitrospira sp.]|jgi:hypothetical protein|nr:hypothetical protein [Nitrospira sp.]
MRNGKNGHGVRLDSKGHAVTNKTLKPTKLFKIFLILKGDLHENELFLPGECQIPAGAIRRLFHVAKFVAGNNCFRFR